MNKYNVIQLNSLLLKRITKFMYQSLKKKIQIYEVLCQ